MKRGVWVCGSVGAATLAVAATRTRRRGSRGGVALVSGGSRGLGLLIARELAARGFRLAICARERTEMAAAEADLTERGAEVLAVVCDVADRGQVDDPFRRIAPSVVVEHHPPRMRQPRRRGRHLLASAVGSVAGG